MREITIDPIARPESPQAPAAPASRPVTPESALSDDLIAEICLRPLFHVAFPRVEIDAIHVKRRRGGRAEFVAVAVAMGWAADDGTCEPLGIDVGDSEDAAFWRRFLHSMRARGLFGVEVVVSADHGGIAQAVRDVFPDARWEVHGEISLDDDA